ncbi:MAG TPA: glycerate kinase [Acidobacteriota bacterium]|nr:glycerate kinase [Acidobacteriota bacterium]
MDRDLKQLRKDAVEIFEAGLNPVAPATAIQRFVSLKDGVLTVADRTYSLADYENLILGGFGKACAAMARALEEVLGGAIQKGSINVKDGHSLPLKVVKIQEAGHPVPNQAGVEGTRKIIQLLEESGERDLVLCVISGGGSALLPHPAEGLTLQDKQHITSLLLECGATIHEINVIRKHLSRVKGGRLARLAYPSTLVSLILSDVVGDDLDSIASGPTVPDRSTFEDCLRILNKYDLEERIPENVLAILTQGAAGMIAETPTKGDPAFETTQNVIIGSNALAVSAARDRAEELGYTSLVLSTLIEGETREVAKVHAAVAKEIRLSGNPVPPPACVISGGETTVTIRGKGLGGRNQEFVLASAIDIDGLDRVVVLSAGTDGTDGPTDAAGALADGNTVSEGKGKGLDAEQFLRENNSYNYFRQIDSLLITGPTYTNVMDLRLILLA